jgi:4-amino-4-deoxy-L-arabinose transferase-like glycosyltransferase
MTNRGWTLALLVAILLLGLGLRLGPWSQGRFLEDEALYSYWGLQIATGADPMLDDEPVDKPPLQPYTLALSFGLFGQNEAAARLPSLLASVTSIALVYALGQTLFEAPVGLAAAGLLALSPFDILFASTAFTDPLLTAWVLAALLAAARGRAGAAGLLAGLAVATKQQGFFFLPLIVVLLALHLSDARRWRPWLRFGLGLGLVAAGVIWWDSARLQQPGFLEQSLISYGGLGPARPTDLGERALEWLQWAGYFWASAWVNAWLGAALLLWLGGGWAGWWPGADRRDGLLLATVAGYLVLHWLVGFQVWDRYLLGLVPLVALLAARALVGLGRAVRDRWRLPRLAVAAAGILLLAPLLAPIAEAGRGELPVGGDHGAYDGIDELAAYLQTQTPPGTVLYHYWLGYHYRFYLYGAPLRLHWYPDLDDLVHDATVYRREPRYIAFPSWRDDTPVRTALAGAGIDLSPVLETRRRDGSPSFGLYRLEGPHD